LSVPVVLAAARCRFYLQASSRSPLRRGSVQKIGQSDLVPSLGRNRLVAPVFQGMGRNDAHASAANQEAGGRHERMGDPYVNPPYYLFLLCYHNLWRLTNMIIVVAGSLLRSTRTCNRDSGAPTRPSRRLYRAFPRQGNPERVVTGLVESCLPICTLMTDAELDDIFRPVSG
jgi:hypothetical protein